MEELIEILIRLIAGLFENKAISDSRRRGPTTPGYQGAAPAPGRLEPASRAPVTRNMPGSRQAPVKSPVKQQRSVRRPQISAVALARPIMTGPVPLPNPAPAPVNLARAPGSKPPGKPTAMVPATAGSIRKWLTPVTLKQQFVLTEILHPPLALRDVPGENRRPA